MDRLILPALIMAALGFAYWTVQRTPENKSAVNYIDEQASDASGPNTEEAAPDNASGPSYYGNVESALRVSKLQHKPMVIIFSAGYCGACHRLLERVCPTPEVRPYYNKFVWVLIDIENARDQAAEIQQRYPQMGESRYIPLVGYVTANGKFLSWHNSVSPDQFASNLNSALAASSGQ